MCNLSELLNGLLSMIVQQLPVQQVLGCCQILQFLQKWERKRGFHVVKG